VQFCYAYRGVLQYLYANNYQNTVRFDKRVIFCRTCSVENETQAVEGAHMFEISRLTAVNGNTAFVRFCIANCVDITDRSGAQHERNNMSWNRSVCVVQLHTFCLVRKLKSDRSDCIDKSDIASVWCAQSWHAPVDHLRPLTYYCLASVIHSSSSSSSLPRHLWCYWLLYSIRVHK